MKTDKDKLYAFNKILINSLQFNGVHCIKGTSKVFPLFTVSL